MSRYSVSHPRTQILGCTVERRPAVNRNHDPLRLVRCILHPEDDIDSGAGNRKKAADTFRIFFLARITISFSFSFPQQSTRSLLRDSSMIRSKKPDNCFILQRSRIFFSSRFRITSFSRSGRIDFKSQKNFYFSDFLRADSPFIEQFDHYRVNLIDAFSHLRMSSNSLFHLFLYDAN